MLHSVVVGVSLKLLTCSQLHRWPGVYATPWWWQEVCILKYHHQGHPENRPTKGRRQVWLHYYTHTRAPQMLTSMYEHKQLTYCTCINSLRHVEVQYYLCRTNSPSLNHSSASVRQLSLSSTCSCQLWLVNATWCLKVAPWSRNATRNSWEEKGEMSPSVQKEYVYRNGAFKQYWNLDVALEV